MRASTSRWMGTCSSGWSVNHMRRSSDLARLSTLRIISDARNAQERAAGPPALDADLEERAGDASGVLGDEVEVAEERGLARLPLGDVSLQQDERFRVLVVELGVLRDVAAGALHLRELGDLLVAHLDGLELLRGRGSERRPGSWR